MAVRPAGEYPVSLRSAYSGQSSRGWAVLGILFLKAIILLPSLIVLGFLGVAQFFIAWIGYFIILFTGRQPEGINRFIAGVLQWQARAYAWLFSLTDRYPPFSLDVDYASGGAARPVEAVPPPPNSTNGPTVPPPPPD
jgi:hypothetical protein